MRATFRPLPAWPYPPQSERSATYKASYSQTLALLESEIDYKRGSEVIIGIVADARDVRMDGMLRADAHPRHPGVELSFEVPGGQRLVFHTDRHKGSTRSWQDNLRAIALGLGALRAVDRYGITESGEQYAGFAQITAGGPNPERGRVLVERAGSVSEALKRHHPDQGGNARDFADVMAYRKTLTAVAV